MTRALNPKLFARTLLRWYGANRREMPWRGERDSYRIWISEVMLQQTRVAVVRERYPAFLQRFPTVKKLAAAKLAAVLAEWSGLGYYRRARALHRAARILVRESAGKLPRSVDQLRRLPGIGRYTAAAIASIAFDRPVAVVDGNVERVLARLHGEAPADPWAAANALLDRRQPGDFNQAMMELGATVCLPGHPLCRQCPVRSFCRAQGELQRQPTNPRRRREVNYALARRNGSIYLVQRSAESSLMPEMWELPAYDPRTKKNPLLQLRHSITDTDYQVNVFATVNSGTARRGRWVAIHRAGDLPLTGLTRKILNIVSRESQPEPRSG